ncbi:MAG: amidohydrolase [Actinomyces sp.]|nr:MAG: amidohydrolase [Actinomyces sp.]
MAATDRYTIISSDSHAGANMATYAEYLDPAWREEFEAWRAAYKNPYRDLQDDGKTRNWDDERRIREQDADGVVAEVTFPNTVPPFYPTGMLIARPPRDRAEYERRHAGIQAHNRWLRDWCGAHPERRRGLPQIFLEDLDDAIRTLEWAAAEGFTSFMLPHVAPDQGLPGLWSPHYDRLWAAVQDLDLVMTQHGGNGAPDYGDDPASTLMFLMEVGFFANRNLWHLIMSGVFERFPRLRYVMTEQGVGWAVEALRRMDGYHRQMKSGRVGELGFPAELVLPMKPSEYFERNVWIGASFPSPREVAAIRELGVHKVMWGSDYPHHEGTYPYTRESLRRSFAGWSEDDLRKVLAENAAAVYGFDLDALAPIAAEAGPTVAEIAEPLDTVPADATSPAFFRP